MGTKSTQMVFSSRNMILREPLFFWLQCPAAAPGTCVCMIRPPARWPSTGSWQKDPCSSTASAMHPPLEIPLRSLWVVLFYISDYKGQEHYMLSSGIFTSPWKLFDWMHARKLILSCCFSHRQVSLATATLSSCKTCNQTLRTTST